MGETRTTITLVNVMDFENAHAGLIKMADVRQLTVNALVDTGSAPLVINEEMRVKLGLRLMGSTTAGVVGGDRTECAFASGVIIYWNERYTCSLPLVIAKEPDTLLGFIPLECMDLRVCPVDQKVEGAHGDDWSPMVKLLR
jgi:predicted aspartyl protease